VRIIFAILGIAAIVLAVFVFNRVLTSDDPFTQEHFYMIRLGTGAIGIAGVAFLIAAIKGYRGHWSFFIGLTLICCGVHALSIFLDEHKAGKAKELEVGVFLALGFMTLGVLSLWSGHKLHNYAKAAENQNDQGG
jgi:uncharacterized membrane protein YuzA (DUF378 family)